MNEVTIKGEVVFVDEVREYGANGFRKHQVVVETGDGKWANPIPVEFIKDTIELSQGLQKGQKVTIDIGDIAVVDQQLICITMNE